MPYEQRRIGIALSGGGIRATIFHLGVFKWLAENKMLEDIVRISSVSGGSLCIGLIYSHNNNIWPSSEQYLKAVLPKIKRTLLDKNIQFHALLRLVISPFWWNKRVNLLAKVIQSKWSITANIADLKKIPLWFINCTTFETGNRFILSQDKMGDYGIGYVYNTNFLLADAIAASAGFPILIGPYKIRTDSYKWEKSLYEDKSIKDKKYLHLWDGGVYDNLGLESLFKIEDGGYLCKDINYLIVSNATGPIQYKLRDNFIFSGKNLKRLLDIAINQVGALRNRTVVDYIKRTKKGFYIRIGNSAQSILNSADISEDIKKKLIRECMSEEEAKIVRDYPTTLYKPSITDLDLIIQHGYEVAKCTAISYLS